MHLIDPKSKAERYEVRISLGGGKVKSKSFAIVKYESHNDAYIEAEEWLKDYSDSNGLTRNMIRKIDDDTIEIKLAGGHITKTDMDFLDLCQKYTINAEYYACFSINNKLINFHNHITGYSMVNDFVEKLSEKFGQQNE